MSLPDELVALEERIRESRPQTEPLPLPFEQSLRQELLEEAMKKNRFLGMGFAALAWRSAGLIAAVLVVAIIWSSMSSRSSPQPLSSPLQEGDGLYTPSYEPGDEAESGSEAGERDQDQETPADLVDGSGEGSELNSVVADPDRREVESSEAAVPSPPTGFALYLAAGEPFIDQNSQIDEIELSEEPLLTAAGIVWYDPVNHIMELTEGATKRFEQLGLSGHMFVVMVDGRRIYQGAFMAATMSRSYDGVVILWPSMLGKERQLQIQLGYPGPDFFSGVDPRADGGVLESLEETGKLSIEQ
jgi:hypothetical protein